MVGHVLVTCPVRWHSFSVLSHIDNAQWRSCSAHYQNCLAFDLQASCELVPAVPSPSPCHPFRDNRLRSHPPHFASTASLPTHSPPQSIKMRRVVPTFLHLCLILVRHYAVNVPVSSRRRSRLHVLSQWSIALVSCVE